MPCGLEWQQGFPRCESHAYVRIVLLFQRIWWSPGRTSNCKSTEVDTKFRFSIISNPQKCFLSIFYGCRVWIFGTEAIVHRNNNALGTCRPILRSRNEMRKRKFLATPSFDLGTSGLWALRASTAPSCYDYKRPMATHACTCSSRTHSRYLSAQDTIHLQRRVTSSRDFNQ